MYQEQFSQRVPGTGGLCFSIQHNPAEVLPWCVQFAGSGHYFNSMPETVEYIRSRKWITHAQAESIIETLSGEEQQTICAT